MKIFITGGTGFIGRYVVSELKKQGHDLLVLSRGSNNTEGIAFIKGDLSNIDRWIKKIRLFGPEAAIHLAWEGIPDFSAVMSKRNLDMSLNLIEVLGDVGCKKIVIIGTCFEYGNATGKLSERLLIEPINAFTASKLSLRMMGNYIAKGKGMEFVWVRPFYIYGGGQREASLIPYILHCAREGVIPTLKTPLAQNDFIYVQDVAMGIILALKKGKDGQIYNLGSGKLVSLKKITHIIYSELAKKKQVDDLAKLFRGRFAGGFYADIVKAKKDLKWRPVVSLEEGIYKTINYQNENNNHGV